MQGKYHHFLSFDIILTANDYIWYCRTMENDSKDKPLGVRVNSALIERLDAWISRQKPTPTKVSTVETAIEEFLDRKEAKEDAEKSTEFA